MSRIFITGDTHGDLRRLNSKNFPEGKNLTKDDYVIILGDFGVVWSLQESKEERWYKEWLDGRSFTTLFVCGNHENHPRLYELPVVDMFNGKVGQLSESIFHLKRGEVYTINDKKFFTMGGAYSVDKNNRTNHISWWKEEIPSHAEMEYGLDNLEKNDNKVDYILSHTAPREAIDAILSITKSGIYDLMSDKVKDATVDYLSHINDITEYHKWYFGHMHPSKIFNFKDYVCLYEHVVELEN